MKPFLFTLGRFGGRMLMQVGGRCYVAPCPPLEDATYLYAEEAGLQSKLADFCEELKINKPF